MTYRNTAVDNAMRPLVEGHIDDMDPKNPLADLKDALKSVLFHFGPEGANKVCDDVIEARKRRPE